MSIFEPLKVKQKLKEIENGNKSYALGSCNVQW